MSATFIGISTLHSYFSLRLAPTPVPLLCADTEPSVKVQLAAKVVDIDKANTPALSRPLSTFMLLSIRAVSLDQDNCDVNAVYCVVSIMAVLGKVCRTAAYSPIMESI